ncbi:hypothetical protein GCM10028789_27920 [Sinomonas halotolerans]
MDGVRHYLGAWSAVSVLQFFAAEAAAIAWWAGPAPYSRRLGFISDLGQTTCAPHGARDVCSPLHLLMNISFVLQGAGMVIAALLITSAVLRVAADAPAALADRRLAAALAPRSLHAASARARGPAARASPAPESARPAAAAGGRRTTPPGSIRSILAAVRGGHPAAAVPWAGVLAVRVLLGIAGVGVAVVGLVPQDVAQGLHLTGAVGYFGGGSLALVVLGVLWLRRTAAGWPVLLCGGVAAAATALGGVLHMEVPEPGTLERAMGYPITAGIALAGAVIAYRLGVRPRFRPGAAVARRGQQPPHPRA